MDKKTKNDYPTLKVITLYPLLGGIIGGLPITLTVVIGILIEQDWDPIFEMLWASIVVTFLAGLIPSALAGILLAYYKIRVLHKANYLKAFFIGWLATFLPAMILVILANIDVLFEWQMLDILFGLVVSMVVVAIFALLGGLTSTLLAKFILPKY